MKLRIYLVLFFYLAVPTDYVLYAYIHVVKSRETTPYNDAVDGFVTFIKEGIEIDVMHDELDKEGGNLRIIKHIKEKKPSLIFTVGTKASQLIKEHIIDIPIVFVMVVDPEKIGLVKDMSIPEDNISGVSLIIPPYRQLRAIKEICSRCTRIGVLYDPVKSAGFILEAESIIGELGMELVRQEVLSSAEVSKEFKLILHQIDLLWLIPDDTVLTWENREYLIKRSVINRLPLYGLSKPYVKKGALLSLYMDYKDIGRQAGTLAVRFLKGEKNIAVEAPEKIHLIVNMNMAKRFGLDISKDVLERVEALGE